MRPPALARTPGVYALYIAGSTMDPEIAPGEVVVLNPNLPPTPTRTHVFYHVDESAHRAMVGRLERMDAMNWYIRQHNPLHASRDAIALRRAEWPRAFRVLKSGELV